MDKPIRKVTLSSVLFFIFILLQLINPFITDANDKGSSFSVAVPNTLGNPNFCECVEYILNRYFNGQKLSTGYWSSAAIMATSA